MFRCVMVLTIAAATLLPREGTGAAPPPVRRTPSIRNLSFGGEAVLPPRRTPSAEELRVLESYFFFNKEIPLKFGGGRGPLPKK